MERVDSTIDNSYLLLNTVKGCTELTIVNPWGVTSAVITVPPEFLKTALRKI